MIEYLNSLQKPVLTKSIAITLSIFLFSCSPIREERSPIKLVAYHNTVGDIAFDKEIDDPKFTLCQPYFPSPQYYWDEFQYEGELSAIKKEFAQKYSPSLIKGQTGYLTIRFIVNCKGILGRFRSYSVNSDFEPFLFNQDLIKQLLDITKELKSWGIQNSRDGTPRDYYQYLTFKIIEGQIIEITP